MFFLAFCVGAPGFLGFVGGFSIHFLGPRLFNVFLENIIWPIIGVQK